MPVRGDEVSGRIEAQIREAIDRMVLEIRASVDDVRVAVDQQLTAALQSIQADVNSVSFGPQIRQAVTELEEQLISEQAPAPAPEPAPPSAPEPGAANASRVKQAIQTVERGKSQVDILNSMLEQCHGFGSRAALMILKGDTFAGWKGVGFGSHGGNDENIKRFSAPAGTIPQLDRLLRDEIVVTWDGANLSERFGVSQSARAILVPMVIKDKVAAAVYVDAIEGEHDLFDPPSIELLVFVTGLLIDTLAIRKKIPSPSLSSDQDEEETVARTPEPSRREPPQVSESMNRRPQPVAPPPPPPPPPPPAIPDIQAADETVAIPSRALESPGFARGPEVRPTAPPPPSFATTAIPALGDPYAAPPPVAPSPVHHEPGEKTSTQYVPPPGLGRGAPQGGAATDQTKKHDEARRFARLLVSEIKLYNESKVEQGRKNRDIYDRLKEDIDRSRQMYDERISEDVRKVSNYFYDELVRILADNNPDALGL